jgi:hypothetical protein
VASSSRPSTSTVPTSTRSQRMHPGRRSRGRAVPLWRLEIHTTVKTVIDSRTVAAHLNRLCRMLGIIVILMSISAGEPAAGDEVQIHQDYDGRQVRVLAPTGIGTTIPVPDSTSSSIPPHAHISARYPNHWECDRGYRLVDSTRCEQVFVPEHAHISSLYPDQWECDLGYHLIGAVRCEQVIVPEHAHISVIYSDRWECDRGYRQLNATRCERVSVPEHAHISTLYADRWECDRGYRVVDAARCEQVIVPEHAHISVIYSDRWECDRGYRQQDATRCERVSVPEHAHISTLHPDQWECDRGYKQAATSGCEPVVVPEHAHLSARYPDRWECDAGYRLDGSRCIAFGPQEAVRAPGTIPPAMVSGRGGAGWGSGHDAGYQWAEENDIDDESACENRSPSFTEGCEDYVEEQQSPTDDEDDEDDE